MNTTFKLAVVNMGMGMGACLFMGTAQAAEPPPSTAEVLEKLHKSNLTEIEAGKLAQDNGHSKATKDYGKMLVSDHTSADKQVVALAKEEKIDLSPSTPVVGSKDLADLSAGPAFDRRFARSMVDDHKKDIAELTAARDRTTDAKLKALLTALLPKLEQHERLAETLEHQK
jgi:putative membrane protein